MVIVRIYPTSGTAIEVQFLSLFVTVSFLKVRVRAHARKEASIRGLHLNRRTQPILSQFLRKPVSALQAMLLLAAFPLDYLSTVDRRI
jgi:hypothetical protein